MLKIEPNGETYLTRADTAFIKPIIEVEDEEKPGKFDPYELQEGDRVIFRLALNSNSPVLIEKDCVIDLENNKAVLNLVPEDTKVAVRNVRREFMEVVKIDDSLSEDYQKRIEEDIQKVTDEAIKTVDQVVAEKEKELMSI